MKRYWCICTLISVKSCKRTPAEYGVQGDNAIATVQIPACLLFDHASS